MKTHILVHIYIFMLKARSVEWITELKQQFMVLFAHSPPVSGIVSVYLTDIQVTGL